jgi:LCP family protein required for cell wall assembly
MYEDNYDGKIRKSKKRRLKGKKNRRRLSSMIYFTLLLIILIVFLNYFGIFPFSSNILSYNRINMLIVGCDEIENQGRADTIVLLSISPKTKNILILSIPRDTRVEIPGRGMDKINHAYAFGGRELISKTVSSFLDIPINFYVIVDFIKFVNIIDELGGVEINIEKEMHYIDKAGGLNINLYPGKQILDGEKALQYIRFRQDNLGDLGRIKRQQKLGEALINKMMNLDSVTKIPQILEGLKTYLETDLKLQDAVALANRFKGVSQDKFIIETVQGNPVYINGISYLEPDIIEVQKKVKSLIYGPNTNRGIKVKILNGNGSSGIAHKIANELKLQGFEVINIDNADSFDYLKTKIIIYSEKVNLNNQFKQLFKDFEIIKKYQTQQEGSDLIIILGKDMID